MYLKPEVAMGVNAVLGEGPVWDENQNLLYWIDSIGDKVFVYDPKTGKNKEYYIGQHVGFIILREKAGGVLGLENGLCFFDLDTGKIDKICDPEEGKRNRVNDGKADANGRIWAGYLPAEDDGAIGDRPPQCGLYMMDENLNIQLKINEVYISNGLTWAPDNKTFYYIDSIVGTVVAYDFDLKTGDIRNKRIVVRIPDDLLFADGMDIDVDGNLWIAHWEGWAVTKWDPYSSKMLEKIDMPVKKVTSCGFGGEDLDELFITTASIGMSEKDWEEQPNAGALFKIKPGVQGRTKYRFKG